MTTNRAKHLKGVSKVKNCTQQAKAVMGLGSPQTKKDFSLFKKSRMNSLESGRAEGWKGSEKVVGDFFQRAVDVWGGPEAPPIHPPAWRVGGPLMRRPGGPGAVGGVGPPQLGGRVGGPPQHGGWGVPL